MGKDVRDRRISSVVEVWGELIKAISLFFEHGE
jgi:hypothetical protein